MFSSKIKFLIILTFTVILILVSVIYPVKLEDSDADFHIAVIENFIIEPNFEIYNGFLFHWSIGLLSLLTGIEELEVLKTLFSFGVIVFIFQRLLVNKKIFYYIFISVLPLVYFFSLTMLRDDLIYLLCVYLIIISQKNTKYKFTFEILICLILIGLRYSAIPVLLLVVSFKLLEMDRNHKIIQKLFSKISLSSIGILLASMVYYMIIRFEAEFSIVSIIKYFIGPLQFVEATIWSQYTPLIYSYIFFKFASFVVISMFIRQFGLMTFFYGLLLSIFVLSPYIFIDSLNGPRQQVYGYLVMFYILLKMGNRKNEFLKK